jgi:uncharacterized protein (TIGR02646 family)
MIRVDRSQINPPHVLTDPNSKGLKEIKKALQHFSPPATPPPAKEEGKTKFKFAAYSHDEVKEALYTLFMGKCAYCESVYASSQPMDVEHWRPKGGYEDDQGDLVQPGYYWLAAVWDNLLPSDIDCNRQRRQRITPLGIELKQGKENQFPLESGSPRAAKPGEELAEKPLLLDPCRDHPEEHFQFNDEAVILPRPIALDQPSPRAQASIEVYALNRSDLVLARRERLLIIRQHMFVIRRLALALNDAGLGEGVHAILDDLLSHEIQVLEQFKGSEQPYALMARQVIDDFLEEFKPA